MPPPTPLTATPAPALDWSRPGTPASDAFGDIYFSVDGGLAESCEVFLRGCGLPEGWEGRERFVIGELGFGTGLNVLAAWQAWREAAMGADGGGRLHIVSVERYPLDREQLARALAHFPEVAGLAGELVSRWPGRVHGVHRLEFADLTLDLHHDEVATALDRMRARADAWFLDGFSPAKNPDMWSPEIMAKIAELSTSDARLATFTVAGDVRRALTAAGFRVERVPGFGRKRHRLEARLEGEAAQARGEVRPVIIGAGIAGASVARAFGREGVVPTVIRAPDHAARAASANPLAMVKPRLDRQDRPESRFFLQAYLYALQVYEGVSKGIVQWAKTDALSERYSALLDQAPLPKRHMRAHERGLDFPTALVIDPVAETNRMLGGAKLLKHEVESWRFADGEWQVLADGEVVASGTHVILASGLHLKAALPDLKLRASRGQLTLADTPLEAPVAYGGYALPHAGRTLLGATHERLSGDSYRLEADDDLANAQALRDVTGVEATNLSSLRASVRVTSANTLPILRELEPQLWTLTALGSRGFTHAPLLGAQLVSRIMGLPEPLAADQAEKLG